MLLANIDALAREITEKVAGDTAEILHVRNGLGSPYLDEIDEQEFRQEAINLANGEEIGCLTEEEALDQCLMTWVKRKIEVSLVAEAGNYRLVGKNSGVGMIVDERLRQIKDEGWTPEHDDEHDMGEMAAAAMCYASLVIDKDISNIMKTDCGQFAREWWPWDMEWWKPSSDPIKNLKRAGALIAAEIDRLQREKARG